MQRGALRFYMRGAVIKKPSYFLILDSINILTAESGARQLRRCFKLFAIHSALAHQEISSRDDNQ
jgi:hypothetical protein